MFTGDKKALMFTLGVGSGVNADKLTELSR
jgi:hypothetical protein